MVKNPPADAGDVGSIPGSGRSPGGGNDNPLQYSCLENSVDRGTWRDTVHRVTEELDMTEQLTLSLSLSTIYLGFPGGAAVKNLPANKVDQGSIPGSGRSPGEGNGNPLQYSCLENSVDRGAWRLTVHGVTKESDMT